MACCTHYRPMRAAAVNAGPSGWHTYRYTEGALCQGARGHARATVTAAALRAQASHRPRAAQPQPKPQPFAFRMVTMMLTMSTAPIRAHYCGSVHTPAHCAATSEN